MKCTTIKRIALTIAAVAAALLLSVAAFAQETVRITHALGTTDVKVNPQKIVVFDFGALDTLDLLGVDVAGLPKQSIPPYLAKYASDEYLNVGSLFEPDYELLNEIKPDLILIGGRQASVYDQLSKLAPTVYVAVDTADYVGSFKKNMENIGRIFGKEAEVSRHLAEIDAAIERIRARSRGKVAFVGLVSGGRVSTFGPGSRYGLVYDVLGFSPVSAPIEESTHGQTISFEFILVYNPDVILAIDRDAATGAEGAQPAKAVIENALVRETKAYKNGQILYLDPYLWYISGGGLYSFKAMIAEIEAGLR